MAPSSSVALKVQWADRHRASLLHQLDAYRLRHPFRVSEQVAKRDGASCRVWRAEELDPVPSEVALTTGDSIDNLRSSLDYLVGEMRRNGPSRHSAFPICGRADGPGGFVSLSKQKLEGVPDDAKAIIEEMQPHETRRSMADDWSTSQALRALETLWNVAKHRSILFGYAFVMPDHATYIRPDGDIQQPGFSLPTTTTPAEIWLPMDSAITDFQAHFEVHVTLAQPRGFGEDWPLWASGWPLGEVVDHLYAEVTRSVLPRFEPFL
jgi:hypothetical protein